MIRAVQNITILTKLGTIGLSFKGSMEVIPYIRCLALAMHHTN